MFNSPIIQKFLVELEPKSSSVPIESYFPYIMLVFILIHTHTHIWQNSLYEGNKTFSVKQINVGNLGIFYIIGLGVMFKPNVISAMPQIV